MPPQLKFHYVSADELEALYRQHGFEEKLRSCSQSLFRIEQDAMHETFCCKKRAIIYTDAANGDEVAIIIEQTYRDPSKGVAHYIFRIRVADDVYTLTIA
jgi:hypothetical protein